IRTRRKTLLGRSGWVRIQLGVLHILDGDQAGAVAFFIHHQKFLDAVLSVEDVGIFKPSAKVYDMVGARFGVAAEEVLFVSSNGWDAAASAGYGFQTVWVNRKGEPVDRLPWKPVHILSDLTGIPDLAGRL
ncbi:MAG: HAD family hydrolase, partial [Pseudomonadota bacterium]